MGTTADTVAVVPGASTGWAPNDDTDLLARARTGDGQAFADLMRRHRRIVDAACASVVPDPIEREDAVQRALVDIWRGLDSFRGDSQLTTWLYRVAQNAARRERRRGLRSVGRVDPAPTDSGATDDAAPSGHSAGRLDGWSDALATRAIVVDAVAALSDDHRDTLLLHTQAGLPLQEIADLKGAPLGTVKAWLHRARAEVARQLAIAENDPDTDTVTEADRHSDTPPHGNAP